tara:strand:+ start:629 stop:997 length:369 start_codon:yes stop_codon:yes gene_type:complete
VWTGDAWIGFFRASPSPYRIMITVSIDVTKLDKSRFYKGKKGTYANLTLIESPNDQYGNTHLVVQSSTKEEREEGLKMPIIGNAKDKKILDAKEEGLGYNSIPGNAGTATTNSAVAQDDIPF